MTDVEARPCPQCKMEMPPGASKCGHCGSRFGEFRNELIIAAVLVAIIFGLVALNLAAR